MASFFPAGRDRGVTVAVEGFFAFVWFGWGQAATPSWLAAPLAVGTGLAALLTVAGVVVTKRSAGRLRVMADPVVRRRYSLIVGVEFGLLGAGAAVLAATGQYRWIAVWICFGVGCISSRWPRRWTTGRCGCWGCCWRLRRRWQLGWHRRRPHRRSLVPGLGCASSPSASLPA